MTSVRPARRLRRPADGVAAPVPAGGEGGPLPRPAASLLIVMLAALAGLVLGAPERPSPLPSDTGIAPAVQAPLQPDGDAGRQHGAVPNR